jgi:hypothetical protein
MRYNFSQNTRTEKHKPKRSPVEASAGANSANLAKSAAGDRSAARGTLSEFEGPVGDSPYYKSLVASSTDATSNAYENAKAASAGRAAQSGFGYGSPIGAAASREAEGTEAGALAGIPAKSYAAAAPLSLQAAGQSAQMGASEGGEALGYFGDEAKLEEGYQQRNADYLSKLWDVGQTAASKGYKGLFGSTNA